jgi:hypothetical protein
MKQSRVNILKTFDIDREYDEFAVDHMDLVQYINRLDRIKDGGLSLLIERGLSPSLLPEAKEELEWEKYRLRKERDDGEAARIQVAWKGNNLRKESNVMKDEIESL